MKSRIADKHEEIFKESLCFYRDLTLEKLFLVLIIC